MDRELSSKPRRQALARAERFSPFLRDALQALPRIGESFDRDGASAAVELALGAAGEELEVELRRQRLGLALAVALGDLAGELSLEQVTAFLSDFAAG
jgi:glutamate-ammonia-ligase adenylyltransferase